MLTLNRSQRSWRVFYKIDDTTLAEIAIEFFVQKLVIGEIEIEIWIYLFLVDLFSSVCNFVSDDGTDILDQHTSL